MANPYVQSSFQQACDSPTDNYNDGMRKHSSEKFAMRCLSLLALLANASLGYSQTVLIDLGKPHAVLCTTERVMAADVVLKKAKSMSADREAENQRQRLRDSVRDLAHYLEKMTGAKIEIRVGLPEQGDKRIPILIGELAKDAFGVPRNSYPYHQGFRIVVAKDRVGLWGESDLASSYAVFEILDRLGCRWFMPGDLGEVIPRHAKIALAEEDSSLTPGTIYRGIWQADEAYRRRNRHGGLKLSAGHALENYITKDERKTHPEWVGVVKGKPSPVRLKWSDPQLAPAIADKILARHQKDPQPSYSLSPDDGSHFDDSKEDQALDANDFDTPHQCISITDRLLVLNNRIAERVTAKHPDVLLGMLAYSKYTRPPVREKVHPNLVPQIAPITYARYHPISDESVPGNKDLRALIEGWGKKAKQTSIYYYGFNLAETSAPMPMIARWSHDVPFALTNNCRFWQPETQPNFETNMHGLYLSCRLAWNPSLKPAEIIDDLHAKFYGNAAKEMAAYWHFIDDAWTKVPEYSGCGFGYLRRFTPERMREARRLIDLASQACKTPEEKQRERLAETSFALFERFIGLRRDLAEGNWTGLADGGEAWMKQVAKLGAEFESQYTFTRSRSKPNTLSASYFNAFYQRTYVAASKLANDQDLERLALPIRRFRWAIDPDEKGEANGWMKADFKDAGWKTTDVCLETWSTLRQHDYFGSMWYRTEVMLPKVGPGKSILLWVGATDGTAKVFINGKHVPWTSDKEDHADEFRGYCKAATWDVTRHVNPGAVNRIAILSKRTSFNELGTGGLLAPVTLAWQK